MQILFVSDHYFFFVISHISFTSVEVMLAPVKVYNDKELYLNVFQFVVWKCSGA